MEVCCTHSIQVTNVSDGECFSYSLVLLEGIVNKNSCNLKNDGIILLQYLDGNVVIKETRGKIQGIRFRVLAHLEYEKNQFVLKFCDSHLATVYFYKPVVTDFIVTPLYVICKGHDGLFQAPLGQDNSINSACQRIYVGAKLIQTLIAEKLNEHAYGRKTFVLDECTRVFHSKINANDAYRIKQDKLWECLAREIMASDIGSPRRKFLAFLSCTFWDGQVAYAHVALGGGGLALFGSACLYTWPVAFEQIYDCFADNTNVDIRHFMDLSYFRGTYASCFSTTLGAVCHELGHAFDLGHTIDGIMGNEFDSVDTVFTFTADENHENNACSDTCRMSFTKINRCLRNFKETVIMAKEKLTPQLNIDYFTPLYEMNKTVNRNVISCFAKPAFENFPNCSSSNNCHDVANDKVFFTKSCATLLAYHRWFTAAENNDKHSTLHFDNIRGVVRSSVGIVVVQLRIDNGYILRSWEFLENTNRLIFLVPLRELRRSKVIFIEDVYGNCIKEEMNCNCTV